MSNNSQDGVLSNILLRPAKHDLRAVQSASLSNALSLKGPARKPALGCRSGREIEVLSCVPNPEHEDGVRGLGVCGFYCESLHRPPPLSCPVRLDDSYIACAAARSRRRKRCA